MENLHLTILKDEGGVGNGASVTIYDAGTENVSTIYSDDGITPAGNPLTADAYGRTNFYAANASYDINVSGTGITEYRLYGIKLFDVKAVDETSANTDKDKAVSNNLAKEWEAKIPLTQKGAASGVAELDADSKVPSVQLPAIAITDTHVAVNEAAQLALTVQKGDVCVRSDENKSYVALNSDNVDMGDWQELLTPTDLVLSVNGKTGAVSLNLDDIGEGTTYKRVTATKEAQIHVQGTDQKLDEGGANEVTVANVKSAVDLKHPQSHTLGSHSTKPHSALTDVTADQHHNEKHDTDKHTNLEYDSASSSGLNFYYKAGRVRNDNVVTNVAAGFVALADDDVNYVEVDGNGVVTDNITSFTSGKIPLYEVTTASGAITDVADKRTWLGIGGGGGGSSTFLGLTDTPASYSGQAGKYAKVNAGEDGLEFDIPSGGSSGSLYSSTFDATTDWGSASGGYYSMQFAHNLNSYNLLVEVWEENGNKIKVEPDRINKDDLNNLTIRVTETPDKRFAGRINICSGGGSPKEISFCIPGDAYVSTKLAQILVGANLANEIMSKLKIYSDTAPTGAPLIVDVNKNGTTIFTTQTKRPEIAIGANAADSDTPDVTSLSEGDRLSVDIDQIGSTVAGGDDLLITIILAG